MTKYDDITDKILRELQADARISNVQLAARVGLSPGACLRRVQDLEQQKVITGYHATVNRVILGRSFVAYTSVGVSDHSRASLELFERTIERSKEVVECYKVTGSFEYLLRIEVADVESYNRFHSEVLGNIPNTSKISTHIVMNVGKNMRD